MASAETPSSVITRFAALLDEAGVPYMLTGSFASGIHGQPRKSRPFSLAEFDRRQLQEIEGRQVFVTSAEDALLSKLEWSKLTESERQLEDAAGIVSIQRDDLDTDYIEKWATTLGLKAQWQKVRALAG